MYGQYDVQWIRDFTPQTFFLTNFSIIFIVLMKLAQQNIPG